MNIAAQTSSSVDQERKFRKLDSNGDGYLSADEVESENGLSVSKDTDRNQDGRIDKAEFSAFEAIRDNDHGSDNH